MTFGERIKRGRLMKGWNQAELARYLPVSTSGVVSYWERGERKPRPDCIPKLARLLDIPVSELVELWMADEIKEGEVK